MEETVKKYGRQVKFDQNITWEEASKLFNAETGLKLSGDALRKRYSRIDIDEIPATEYHKVSGDGTIEAQKIVNLSTKEKDNPNAVLSALGYNPSEWQLDYMLFSNWQQHTKEKTTKNLYAVKFKIKPKVKEIDPLEVITEINKMFSNEIKPMKLQPSKMNKTLDKDKMMECPAIELHLGKLAWSGDTGQDYDQHIAKARFKEIIQTIIDKQSISKCGTLFITIGSDFFNSDTVQNTTTKGTIQQNDVRWKKMFLVGVQLYVEAFALLKEHFNKIDVQLCQGNHDNMSAFYLYIALKNALNSDKTINFSDNIKETQCYQFGQCVIFTNHGDVNLNRLIKSITAEFYQEWGQSLYRELHLGHLHKEVMVDDNSGMITRRIGSPSGTDEWHYHERFIGAIQKHQLFIWEANTGLKEIIMIPFERENEKVRR
jgi:hypothetical protein